ncbi:MAG: hypothetical protein AB203_01725 [Parcubacteria bacterium C7867-008]|nr:MAG: hypothetical protein AB203_01725 [Parcubacteria bacterium C7867-008]
MPSIIWTLVTVSIFIIPDFTRCDQIGTKDNHPMTQTMVTMTRIIFIVLCAIMLGLL